MITIIMKIIITIIIMIIIIIIIIIIIKHKNEKINNFKVQCKTEHLNIFFRYYSVT